MDTEQKWFYCLRAMESIRELSAPSVVGDVDPFLGLAVEDRLEYINDLILGTIDLMDEVPVDVPHAVSIAEAAAVRQ